MPRRNSLIFYRNRVTTASVPSRGRSKADPRQPTCAAGANPAAVTLKPLTAREKALVRFFYNPNCEMCAKNIKLYLDAKPRRPRPALEKVGCFDHALPRKGYVPCVICNGHGYLWRKRARKGEKR